MRQTSYYGRKIGAIVVEKRKGSVSEVKVGDVRRSTASEQEMGAPLLTFVPTRTFDGKLAKQIAIELSALRLAAYRLGTPTWDAVGDYDTALMSRMVG